jgi:hypothetical protein
MARNSSPLFAIAPFAASAAAMIHSGLLLGLLLRPAR